MAASVMIFGTAFPIKKEHVSMQVPSVIPGVHVLRIGLH